MWVDGLRTQWRTNVVEYDLASQIRSLQTLRSLLQTGSERMTRSSTDVSTVRRAADIAFVALIAIGLLALSPLIRRRRAIATGGRIERSASQRRASVLFRDLSRRLHRHGVARQASQTPQELLAETRARSIPHGELAAEVVERYEAVRYGQQPLSADELRDLRDRLRKL